MGPALTPVALFYQKEKERKEAGTHVTPSKHEEASPRGSQAQAELHLQPLLH